MAPGKCDSERPCTLCSRAGVQCVAAQTTKWVSHVPGQVGSRARASSGSEGRAPAAKRRRGRGRSSAAAAPDDTPTRQTLPDQEEDGTNLSSPRRDDNPVEGQFDDTTEDPWANSSSTIMLVEEAFHRHDVASPETLETSALGYGQTPLNPLSDDGLHPTGQRFPRSNPTPRSDFLRISRGAAQELTSLLPSHDVANILVEIYFDKVHWFMLLFHQLQFRASVSDLYSGGTRPPEAGTQHSGKGVGFVSVFLAVCALSLRLISNHHRRQLIDLGIEADVLRERILAALRLRLLEILALGSLEAVQMCVLLGSYHLYHGEPELAWPLCGCALRLAQALELHRCPQLHAGSNPHRTRSPQNIEARKRCWWAIHEIETFCSMIYGFPQSISDTDCDVGPLNPNDPQSIAADAQLSSSGEPTLLEYKCAMSRLSRIIKSTLTDLYGLRQGSPRPGGTASRSRELLSRVSALDARLGKWHSELPEKLRLGKLAEPIVGPPHDSDDQTAGSTATSFTEQLFQLQALALKLAFENARILIHRPLLSYKVIDTSSSSNGLTIRHPRDPFSLSIQTCRDAALQISWTSNAAIFNTASTTYALSFVSLHLLTAGVTLCIMTTLDPLSRQAHDWKLGVRRLMGMLMALRSRTVLADQGLQLLRKLLQLVMKKETEKMLQIDPNMSQSGPTDSIEATDFADLPGPSGTLGNTDSAATDFDWASFSVDNPMPFEFHEDLLMTQAMQDVEQVINYQGPIDMASDNLVGADFDPSPSGSSFIGQDQSWLWGSAFNSLLEQGEDN